MTRRTRIRIVSYLTAAFCALIAFSGVQLHRARHAERLLAASYARAESELCEELNQLSYTLTKGQYVTSPALFGALSAEIFSRSTAASAALSQLPAGNQCLEKTAKFITQTGDYAFALGRAAAQGKLPEDAAQNLAALAGNAGRLGAELSRTQLDTASGGAALSGTSFSETLENIEQEFPAYPTLIYDGPFSEHLTDRRAAMLAGKPEISKQEAQRIAAKFLAVSESSVTCDDASGGKLPTYTAHCGEITLDITRAGGEVLLLLSNRALGAPKLSNEEALRRAEAFLAAHGYSSLRQTYFQRYSGTLTVNFAAVTGDVLLYPDLIKLTVALDTGEIVNFETTGYLMNHRARTLPETLLPQSNVLAKIPNTLTVRAVSLALIPTDGGQERLTYEVTCQTAQARHILLYFDAQTGEEVRIFILIENENGTLTM